MAKRNDHLSKQLEAASTTRSGDASLQLPPYSSIPDKKSLRGIALPDPDIPFLISPLPQFTTPLTTSSDFSFTSVPPVPKLSDDLKENDDAADSEPEHEAATPIAVPQDLRQKQLSDGSDSASAHTSPYLDHRRARSGSNSEMYTCPWSVNASADAPDAPDASDAAKTTEANLKNKIDEVEAQKQQTEIELRKCVSYLQL